MVLLSGQVAWRGSRCVCPILALAFLLPWLGALASYVGARYLLLVIFFVVGSVAFAGAVRVSPANRDRFFIILIGAVSMSLLLSATLVSDNLAGYDIHEEFYMYQQVSRAGVWQSESPFLYNTSLSITILPLIVSLVSSFGGVPLFKLMFPLLFSCVPLVLYKTYRKSMTAETAFLAVLFFMSYPTFYEEMIQLSRQETGEFMVVLVLWLILSRKLAQTRSGALTIVVLTAGVVVSHYSLAYIYLFLLGFLVVSDRFSRRVLPRDMVTILFFSLVLVLSWYAFVAGQTALTSLASVFSSVANGLWNEFLSPTSRPLVIFEATGLSQTTPGILHQVNRAIQLFAQFCLTIGFLAFLRKPSKSATERTMFPLMTVGVAMLGCAIVLPFFGAALTISRIYQIALLFIAPCFPYGVELLYSAVWRIFSMARHGGVHVGIPSSQSRVMAASILIIYFLFSSGWVWAVTMDQPTSRIFDGERMENYPNPSVKIRYFDEFVVAQDLAAALWVRSYRMGDRLVCADYISKYHVLNSYGGIPRSGVQFTELPLVCRFSDSYFYLSVLNMRFGIGATGLRGPLNTTWSISEIYPYLVTKNRIYSNGGASIYG